MWLLYVVIGLLVLAALSAGIALGLHLIVPQWSARRRVLVAGGIAALLPMTVVFGGFFYGAQDMDTGDGEEFLLGFLALFIMQVILWAIVSLPPAWFITQRLERGKNDLALPAGTTPELLEG